ncbi:MAG: lysylphosphatidylglycerol synthase transmembrane domain-containing protein [Bacteroidales bacterium]
MRQANRRPTKSLFMGEINERVDQHDVVRRIRPRNIILPVIIGLSVVLWLMLKNFDSDSLSVLVFNWRTVLYLAIAICCMVGRDLGYIIRIRILTEKDLAWRKAFRVIMLWEFTSAISPSTVGGTAVAVVFIHKEGISVGRSTSVVLVTSFLDELYFVVMFPLLLILIKGDNLFMSDSIMTGRPWFVNELFIIAVVGYTIKLTWVVLVGYGIFINPSGLKSLVVRIFRLPFLERWKDAAINAGDDIVTSSRHFRTKGLKFWLRAGFTTFLSWSSRYWVANAILVAFFAVNNHFLIFARQLVMWIMMLISPTPGGSGLAELVFTRYLSDFVPASPEIIDSTALAIALIWRAISYYPYLIIGALIAPGWVTRNFISGRRHKKIETKPDDH